MELYNLNGQLQIVNGPNQEFYRFQIVKSFSPAVDANGNWYVTINFIANDKNNSLRLYLKDITNLGLNNDADSATNLARILSSWCQQTVNVVLPINSRFPRIIRSIGAVTTVVPGVQFSISFASTGTANATIIVNGTTVVLRPGESISYEAGDPNIFLPGYFSYNTSLSGAELLIIYVQ